MIRLDTRFAVSFVEASALDNIQPRVLAAHRALLEKTGAGREWLGWRALLLNPNDALLADIQQTADQIRAEADVFLCIGIGGSYLGSRALIEALSPYFKNNGIEVYFVGHHMSGAYLQDLLTHLEGKSVFVNVISKSGTTLEPALAFRFVREWLQHHYPADWQHRIIATTDPQDGALCAMQEIYTFKKYEIPKNVGGRFSVLTPVGLLPIAVAGVDIRTLFYGAVAECQRLVEPEDNPALAYAALRYVLLQAGYMVEALAVFEPKLFAFGGWWQQLFGESEGKEGKGIFPTTLQYSTDLHSLGQYVQAGKRILFETFLIPAVDGGEIEVPYDNRNHDGLNYLEGKTYTHINQQAYAGTAQAHLEGGTPNLTLNIPAISAESLGNLIYFFQHTVAVSAYLLGVNPFTQPGVEAYKQKMFTLLDRPTKK